MTVDMEDLSGQPRRDEEIERVLVLIKQRMTDPKATMQNDPEFFVNFLCIKDCLEELLRRRKS